MSSIIKGIIKEEAQRLSQLETAYKQAQQITRAIKYEDGVMNIISQIQGLGQKYNIDPKSIKYAVSDVLEAKNALESAVYGLDELFKDAYQEEKWKHDDEREGLGLREGEVVSLEARRSPLVVAGSPYDWDIYDLRTNKMVANILGGDRHESPLYEIRINRNGMTPTTRMKPTYVLRAGRNNNPPYKAYELVDTADRYGEIEKSPGPGGTTKLRPDQDDMLRHMFKVMGGGKYYGYDLNLVEEGLDQYEIIEKALGAKIMEVDDAMELGYTDWDPEDSSSIVYLGNKVNKDINEFFDAGDDDDDDPDEEEILHKLASMWWNGSAQQKVKIENTLEAMGWSIGEDEGSDAGGVFVVQIDDEHGSSYISWSPKDLQLDEDYSAGASGGAGIDEGKLSKTLGALALGTLGAVNAHAHTDTTKSVDQLAKERPALAQRLKDIGATGQVPASDIRARELQKKQDQELPASERRARELEKLQQPNMEEGQIYSTGGGPGEGWRWYKPKPAGTKESSIMKGLQTEQNVNEYEIDSKRTITFSKENPPNIDYAYQQFIHNMLSSTNSVQPKDWIDAMNNRYGTSYTWKDYQNKGHKDYTNNWDKIVKRYILKQK